MKLHFAVFCGFVLLSAKAPAAPGDIETVAARAVQPVMERYHVPGMAVGIVTKQETHVYNFGVASKTSGRPVTDNTLFEIGSVSKTFTAILASHARVIGKLSLSDAASQYLPSLRGSSFDKVNLRQLGTHTPGGFPLKVPDGITNDAQMMAYFQAWKPEYPPGTYRTYSNLGIGMLGMIAAASLGQDFTALMQGGLFPALDLTHTYLDVPNDQAENYAQGYTMKDQPIRLVPEVLTPESRGIRTTAADLLRYIEANMGMLDLEESWRRAITETHIGYCRAEAMTQDLMWEQVPYPVELKDLLAANSDRLLLQPVPVTEFDPPLPPRDDVLINKTGSTNGFAAYVAFVPGRKLGVVILANKEYPISARVRAAFEILTRLDH